MRIIRLLWAYRGFILSSVGREFQLKYRNSLFGPSWVVINPVAMIVVYTIIFSQVMRARLPGLDASFAYSIYLCSGILTWGLFSEITSRAQTIFLENANLIKKINFPKICLPLVVVVNALMNFLIIFGIFLVFLILSGNFPGITILAMLPLLAILVTLAIGLGITLGLLNVFFRDVGQFFGIFLQFWFWLTPIVYPASVLPEAMRDHMWLNPMASLTVGFQAALMARQWPDWNSLVYPTLVAVLFCMNGMRLFRKHARDMVDEL
jgi:lipopolysaccharide transport system permease protein